MDYWPFPTSKPNSESEERASPTELASKYGVRFFHIMDGSNPCTIAYLPLAREYKNSKMMEVAVAYKHPNDQYCKKTGATIAAERILNNQSILMPLRGKDNHETLFNIYNTFSGY